MAIEAAAQRSGEDGAPRPTSYTTLTDVTCALTLSDVRPGASLRRAGRSGASGYLAIQLASELRNLGLRRVPGFLKDRRDLGVGDEVVPALRIPVEEHPHPALLIGIAIGV